MQTLQTPLKFSVQRNGSVTPLIAANHLPVAKRESSRPSSSTTQVEKEEPLTIRSKIKVFSRKLCIILQTTGASYLTHAEFKKTGIHMLKVSDKLRDMFFFRNTNSIINAEDAIANEVVYHDVCWVKTKREARPKAIKVENFVEPLSDIELVNYF